MSIISPAITPDYGKSINRFSRKYTSSKFPAQSQDRRIRDAEEDAPQRALRSSLAIYREMAKFSDRLRPERKDIPVVKMRIGIHTGPVAAGTVGNNLRVEFKAVGDTVNLAPRREGQAEPGRICIAGDTLFFTISKIFVVS